MTNNLKYLIVKIIQDFTKWKKKKLVTIDKTEILILFYAMNKHIELVKYIIHLYIHHVLHDGVNKNDIKLLVG